MLVSDLPILYMISQLLNPLYTDAITTLSVLHVKLVRLHCEVQ